MTALNLKKIINVISITVGRIAAGDRWGGRPPLPHTQTHLE